MYSAPVDVEAIIRRIGIGLSKAYLNKEIAGMIERTRDNKYHISVNVNDPLTRQRFTMAHELGHYIYHKNLIGEGIDDDKMYRSTEVGKYHNTYIGKHEETQANRFAANLLMPYSLIENLKGQGFENPHQLAEKLIVSPHAMHIRLGVPYEPLSRSQNTAV